MSGGPLLYIADDALADASDADIGILLADLDEIMATDISPDAKLKALRAAVALFERAVRGVL